MTLTIKTLQEHGACSDQVELFRSLFGESVELTEALAIEHGDKFDIAWCADNLLKAPALAEYRRVIAPAFVRLYIEQEEK